ETETNAVDALRGQLRQRDGDVVLPAAASDLPRTQGGMLIGPALGGFIALLNLGVVFTIAAALSAITVIALVTLPNVRAQATVEVPARAFRSSRSPCRRGCSADTRNS